MPDLICLVNADPVTLRRTAVLLSDAGFSVAALSSFEDAKEELRSLIPALLVADVRLGAFNGLHLAMRSRVSRPGLPVVITHTWPDPVLEMEANRQNVAFVVSPLKNPGFLRSVRAAIAGRPDAQSVLRQWLRKRLLRAEEAKVADRSARIVDLSYGGLRLAVDGDKELPAVFGVSLPARGVVIRASRVWGHLSPAANGFWCGASLMDLTASEMVAWRSFVDLI
jgi:DNA-binding NtrC family response regulator